MNKNFNFRHQNLQVNIKVKLEETHGMTIIQNTGQDIGVI